MNTSSVQPIDSEEISRHLTDAAKGLRVETFGSVTSTNTIARERAVQGEDEGLVVIASSQTEGRGRKGRSFFSPDGTGIYMSLLLRPTVSPQLALRITTAAAVSVCQAIAQLTDRTPGIKWVNDILIDSRKVCGILTETALGSVPGQLDFAILGIGINALEPEGGFPDDIRDIAGSVFAVGESDRRAELAAGILSGFMENYPLLAQNSLADAYRSWCIVPGRRVRVLSECGVREALAVDVDDECRLMVRYDDGTEALLHSGEISIKL